MDTPDVITVVVTHREEIRAHQADVLLSAKASSLVTGDAAMKKAKELAHVVSQLGLAGVKDEHIILREVLAERTGPVMGPANPSTYLLRVHCPDLNLLPDLLVVVTAQRNVILDQLIWLFPDDAVVRARWLADCLSQAREKAGKIAASLGVRLLGVHSLTEKWTEPGDDQKRVNFSSPVVQTPKPGADRNTPVTFPMVISKHAEIEVEAKFRVSAYE